MKQPFAIKTSKQYDRDVKLAKRRGLDIEKLLGVIKLCVTTSPYQPICTITFCLVTTKAIGSAM